MSRVALTTHNTRDYSDGNVAIGGNDAMCASVNYLTTKEIASILKVSVRTVQRNITTQAEEPSLLKAIRVGRRGLYRIPEAEFTRWLQYNRSRLDAQGHLGL